MVMSAADEFRAEGMAEMVARFLQGRYGEVPPGVVKRMQRAKPEEVDAWAVRLFKGESPEAVFGRAGRR